MLQVIKEIWAEYRKGPKSFPYLCQKIDSRFRIPRPAAQQYWTAYQAVVYLTEVGGRMLTYLVLAGISVFLFYLTTGWLTEVLGKTTTTQYYFYTYGAMWALIVVAFLAAIIESMDLLIPFRRSFQRSTYGSAQWADILQLEDMGFARPVEDGVQPGEIALGRLGLTHNMLLPKEQALLNLAFFGPPGSGKSKTFLMRILQVWAKGGSTIVLDPKGELFEQTAHKYRNAYRINLDRPELSDRWNFMDDCKGNVRVAREIGFLLASSDEAEARGRDPFWKNAEKMAFAALLNLVASSVKDSVPADLAEMIALSTIDDLNARVMASADKDVRTDWGSFTKLKPETQANVLIGMSVIVGAFTDPVISEITQPPTEKDLDRGVRSLTLDKLRQPGTAIYVIVPEGRDKEFQAFLAVLFGLAAAKLRDSSMGKAQEFGDLTSVLFILDELANLPAVAEAIKISQLVSMGRGRRMLAAMGFQSKAQMYDHLGRERTDAILGSVGTFVFLPGITDQTTLDWASQLTGQTTAWQHTSVDVLGSAAFDSSRSTEVGRALLTTAEIRQMVKYEEALAVISNVPPIRFRYPDMVAVANPSAPRRQIAGKGLGLVEAPEEEVEDFEEAVITASVPKPKPKKASGGGMAKKSEASARERDVAIEQLPGLDEVMGNLELEAKKKSVPPPQPVIEAMETQITRDPTLKDMEPEIDLPANHLDYAF
ncbi:MAG: type IV secretory system conjugative DNA transfer family protein [Acidobacteria bacterium]|nr:type IV secretory system conjugative DNA transfer family protein [Acidobacteriota bacterium]